MQPSLQAIDRIRVRFDHDNAVADAGLLTVATLVGRLGLENVVDGRVTVGHRPGRKLATLVTSIVAGGRSIDDVNALRAGATAGVLGHDVVAASTVGSWLRAFTFGHVRQLDHVAEQLLTRAWAAGAGPGDGLLTIDIDSTIVEVHGKHKQGASYGYTRQLGLHPMLAVRADTGEVLHLRTREGKANTGRGAARFVVETIGRVRRAGATGRLLLRFDSGYWSKRTIAACEGHDTWFSMTVNRQQGVMRLIDAIDETAWVDIDYIGARAQVAETVWQGHRMIVRRTLNFGEQPGLFEDWRHHAFVTNRPDVAAVELDADHRAHAVVELAIRDLKHGVALDRMPSGVFQANAAWAVAVTLAHNLLRWLQLIGDPGTTIRTAATIRRRLLQLPGRLVTTARRTTLRLPTRWPWADVLERILTRIRALPQPC